MQHMQKQKLTCARKEHACIECLEPIRVGATYISVSDIDEEGPFRIPSCASCFAWRNAFFAAANASSKYPLVAAECAYGMLWEDIKVFTETVLGYNPTNGEPS